MLPYRSVMVTGAGGFVGRYLLDALRPRLAGGATLHRTRRDDGEPVDLRDADGIRQAVIAARPDLVIHLAAQSSVGQSAGAAAATWRVNVAGTLNLAEAVAIAAPDAAFAFVSSSEVYGATFNTGTVGEESPLAPLSVYARTKRAGEDLLRDVLAPTNRLLIFRPTNHSGPGQDTRFVLPAFAEQIAAIEAGRQPPVISVGALGAERDFLDVRDVVDAYLAVLELPDPQPHETFNIASGKTVPVSRLLDILLSLTDRTIAIEQDPARMRQSEIARTSIDTRRLAARTGWQPRRALADTVADVLADRRLAVTTG